MSTDSAGLAVYRDLLRLPHVARFALGGVIVQFPYGMVGIALLIGVRDGYGQYTLAGILAAVQAISGAIMGPQIGRAIDYWGQSRVVSVVGTFWLICHAIFAACIYWRVPEWMLFIAVILLGVNIPGGSIFRARWTMALKDTPGKMGSALSLTSVLEEFMWVFSIPVATALATLISPIAPLVVSVFMIIIGMWSIIGDRACEPPATKDIQVQRKSELDFTSDEAARESAVKTAQTRRISLYSPGFIALMTILIFYGAFQSTTGVAVVAFAQEMGAQEWAGVVSACFSVASMLSAIAYGARVWTSPLWLRFAIGLVILAIGCSTLVFVNSMWMAGLVMFCAGLAQAPTVINLNQILVRIVPSARFSEGMALQGSMWVVGISTANLVAGAMIDARGSMGGFLTIVGFAVAALCVGACALGTIRKQMRVADAAISEKLLADADSQNPGIK
ncbi:MAG: hypothetical protein Q4C87_09670 [Actinomycetaceae bacterium]|nr:hypothetical protein [Actinomycetaceae bacterium]